MAEILDGPPSIRDRVVEQAEYIRLLEEKLAEAKNRHAEHLAAHRTADAHDCAEIEEMYQREKAEVERLQELVLNGTLGDWEEEEARIRALRGEGEK